MKPPSVPVRPESVSAGSYSFHEHTGAVARKRRVKGAKGVSPSGTSDNTPAVQDSPPVAPAKPVSVKTARGKGAFGSASSAASGQKSRGAKRSGRTAGVAEDAYGYAQTGYAPPSTEVRWWAAVLRLTKSRMYRCRSDWQQTVPLLFRSLLCFLRHTMRRLRVAWARRRYNRIPRLSLHSLCTTSSSRTRSCIAVAFHR